MANKIFGWFCSKKKKKSLDSGYYSPVIEPTPAETGKRTGERRSEGRTPLRKKKNTSSIGVGERGLGQNSEVLSLLETRILQLQAGRMGAKL